MYLSTVPQNAVVALVKIKKYENQMLMFSFSDLLRKAELYIDSISVKKYLTKYSNQTENLNVVATNISWLDMHIKFSFSEKVTQIWRYRSQGFDNTHKRSKIFDTSPVRRTYFRTYVLSREMTNLSFKCND